MDYQKFKIIWILCIGVACYGLFYIANIYLLRELSITEQGSFAVSLKTLTIICAFLTISKQLSLNLYMPQYEKSHRYIQQDGLALWLGKNLILSGAVLLAGVAFISFVIHLIQNKAFIMVFQNHPYQFILFFIPILAFFTVLSCLALVQETTFKLAPFIIIFPSLLIVSIFTLAIYTLQLSSLSTIITYFICQAVTLAIYLFLSSQYYTPRFLETISSGEHDHYYSSSYAYWLNTFSNQASTLLCLFALELFAPNHYAEEYAIILLFITAYIALVSPLHTYLASQLNLLIHNNSQKLNQIVRLTTRIQGIVILLCISLSIAFGRNLLTLIHTDAEFLYPQLIFAMIMFGIAIITAVPLRIILHGSISGASFYLKTSRLILCCLLLSVLIPKYGIAGAIISDTLPLIMTHIIASYLCKKQLNLEPSLHA